MSPLPPLGFFAHGAAITGDYQAIMTATVDSGGSAAITFSSIPSTFKHLQIRWIARGLSGGAVYTQFNGDTGSNYSAHNVNGDGATAGAQAQSSTSTPLFIRNGGISTTANIFTAGIMDILDYASTNKAKTIRNLGGHDLNGSGLIELASEGWYATPAAISSITITHNGTGFAQFSQFALFGLKG